MQSPAAISKSAQRSNGSHPSSISIWKSQMSQFSVDIILVMWDRIDWMRQTETAFQLMRRWYAAREDEVSPVGHAAVWAGSPAILSSSHWKNKVCKLEKRLWPRDDEATVFPPKLRTQCHGLGKASCPRTCYLRRGSFQCVIKPMEPWALS